MRLTQLRAGRYRLKAEGGDASDSYLVDVTFDKERALERTRTWGEGMQVGERTVYYKFEPFE
jgi:hypothetical protein